MNATGCLGAFARLAGTAFLLAIAAVQIAPGQQPASHDARDRVVLITLDGLPARALDDPRLPMPHLREMMRNGARARAMVPINPTVTWPNHTTLITGVNASVHHVMANGLIVQPPNTNGVEVKPWVPKDDLVHALTLYDAGAAAGLTTGQVDWVAIYGAKNVAWQFGEKPDPHGPIAQDLVAGGLLTQSEVEHFGDGSSPAWRDEIWTDAAIDILSRHKPDLMLIHLLETDTLQHAYGPLTPASYAAYAFADTCVGRIVDATRAAGTFDHTTFIVTADHGFASVTHVIRPNVLLSQLDHSRPGPASRDGIRVLAEGGATEVFASPETARSPAFAKFAQALAATPGVRNVATGAQLAALGLPAPGTTDQAPALYASAAPGYAFVDDASGSVTEQVPLNGQHGYLNDNPDMQAIFVAFGNHIRPGVTLPTFRNLQVAPTIAQLLHLKLPAATAPPLDEILH